MAVPETLIVPVGLQERDHVKIQPLERHRGFVSLPAESIVRSVYNTLRARGLSV